MSCSHRAMCCRIESTERLSSYPSVFVSVSVPALKESGLSPACQWARSADVSVQEGICDACMLQRCGFSVTSYLV